MARRSLGARHAGLVMDGITPARMPERVIAESHRREVNGLIEVSKPSFRAGDRLRARDGQKLARAGKRAVENMLEASAARTIKCLIRPLTAKTGVRVP